jgi:hypothetical protein
LDFKAIAQTPILDVAKLLGLKLTEKGEQWVGSCPISQTGNATAFKITPKLNRFICFCPECKKFPKQGGDCIELVARMRRVGHREAAAFISGAGKADDNARPQQEVADGRKPSGFDPLKYLASLATEHDALKDLDIMPETLVAFQAGYAGKGPLRGRLSVAWHDVTGEIKVFVGVALNGDLPLYLMGDKNPMPYWFGTHRVEEGELRIVPTILDVMRAWENGATNVICPLAPTNADSLTCLQSLCATKKLTVEF